MSNVSALFSMENISIIIPVYNEAAILAASLSRLLRRLRVIKARDIEILLVDNGSGDSTAEIITQLQKQSTWVRPLWFPYPDFGEALRSGIRAARGSYILLLNADWWDWGFIRRAYTLREDFDIIVASKRLRPHLDKRPVYRKAGSWLLASVANRFFEYRGTDTHGLKLMSRKRVLPILERCVTDEILETELLIRSQRAGLAITELPCPIREVRTSRATFVSRCWRVLRELSLLARALVKPGRPTPPLSFHADDVGYNRTSLVYTARLQQTGQLASLSLLVNMDASTEGAELARRWKIPVIIHINLIEGKPVSQTSAVPSLVNERGDFFRLPTFLLRLMLLRVNPKDVETEIAAQLRWARSRGIAVAGLDSHRNIHMFSPVAEALERIIRRKRFSWKRGYGNFITFTPRGVGKLALAATVAIFTRMIHFAKFNFPPSWKKDPSMPPFCALSWERVPRRKFRDVQKLLVVVHPGLPFDKSVR